MMVGPTGPGRLSSCVLTYPKEGERMSALGVQVEHLAEGRCLECGWCLTRRGGESPYEHARRTGHQVSQRDTVYTFMAPVGG